MKKERKLLQQLQVEVDTAFLYKQIALRQDDDTVKAVLTSLSKIEEGHAKKMLAKLKLSLPHSDMPSPSRKARIQLKLASWFGYDSILNGLSDIEQKMAQNAIREKRSQGIEPNGFEQNHLEILNSLSANPSLNVSGKLLSRFEGKHKAIGGNALRAAVLGANDGLVSNMSLVMGVAGAAASNATIVLTGLSGLLAGAISMALGEWISVQSSRELNQRQIDLETEEIEASPEEEKQELILIYQAKGMEKQNAINLVEELFKDKQAAINALVHEELGIDQEELGGSAWEAAISSFILFALGAILPVFPYFFLEGITATYVSLLASLVGLFGIGAAITLFTGRSVMFSGLRQVVFGIAAAAVTYFIGHLIGVSIAG